MFKARVLEYQRNVGTRIKKTHLFESLDERDEFVIDFNDKNTKGTSNYWYLIAMKL